MQCRKQKNNEKVVDAVKLKILQLKIIQNNFVKLYTYEPKIIITQWCEKVIKY